MVIVPVMLAACQTSAQRADDMRDSPHSQIFGEAEYQTVVSSGVVLLVLPKF